MKKIALIISSCFFSLCFSQKNLKTFKRANKFQNETYTYYTNSNNLSINVKQGKYSFTENYPNSKKTVIGKFKDDFKDGRWSDESSSIIKDSYDNQKHTKNYNYNHIDYSNGVPLNGEYNEISQIEDYNGITRINQKISKHILKYSDNKIKSFEFSENINGITKNALYEFDEEGFLKAGNYCYNESENSIFCNEKNDEKYKLIINEFGVITKIPKDPDNYGYGYEFNDDFDSVSIDYARKARQNLVSGNELVKNNIEVKTLAIYKFLPLIKRSETEVNLFKNLKGGYLIYGIYKENRNKQLFNQLYGNWKLIEVINDGISTVLGNTSQAKFNFQEANLLSIHKDDDDRVGERTNIRIDGKNKIILVSGDNDNYVPTFMVVNVNKSNLILKRKTQDGKEQILKFSLYYRK